MPNIKSAIKRVRQNEKIRPQKAAQKSALRTAIKNFEKALEKGNTDEAKQLLQNAVKLLDKAASKGLIHKNAASRKKSRLTQKFNKAS